MTSLLPLLADSYRQVESASASCAVDVWVDTGGARTRASNSFSRVVDAQVLEKPACDFAHLADCEVTTINCSTYAVLT